jgi:hypothetical protein
VRLARDNTNGEHPRLCGALEEPSPTGRAAAGRLSRKVTGEVFSVAAFCVKTLLTGTKSRILSFLLTKVQGLPLPKEV